jgi:hypothetical protein
MMSFIQAWPLFYCLDDILSSGVYVFEEAADSIGEVGVRG